MTPAEALEIRTKARPAETIHTCGKLFQKHGPQSNAGLSTTNKRPQPRAERVWKSGRAVRSLLRENWGAPWEPPPAAALLLGPRSPPALPATILPVGDN